jgi:antitoxin (DNA-binding transcriptional repressor) of toxin-antitoxin stability system
MKTATVRELRNDFHRLSKWLDKADIIEITKRGRPIARLVPKPKAKLRTLLGATPSPYPLPVDIDDSLIVEWKAAK